MAAGDTFTEENDEEQGWGEELMDRHAIDYLRM
jgi:hypothetical protein